MTLTVALCIVISVVSIITEHAQRFGQDAATGIAEILEGHVVRKAGIVDHEMGRATRLV
jgi:hypothetical protein